MKMERWVIGGGVGFVIGISVVAMFADDLWEDEYHDAPAIAAGSAAPHRDGREKIACSSCHVILAGNLDNRGLSTAIAENRSVAAPTIVPGAVAPHNDGRENMVCQNCHVVAPR